MKSIEPIYVSITSWSKRINNVKPVLETIKNQSLQPYKIIINLCIQDFPELEKDLPQDLLDFVHTNDDIEIYWYVENYKSWKKHIHLLDILPDNALGLSIDDDHLYPTDFIEKMYLSYCYYGKKFPITLNKILLVHSAWCFNGPGTLYRKSDWGDYKKFLTYDILHNTNEDVFLSVLFHYNNAPLAPMVFNVPDDNDMLFNDINAVTDIRASDHTDEHNDEIKIFNAKTIQNVINIFEKYKTTDTPKYIPNVWQIMYEFFESFDKDNLKYDAFKFAMDNFNEMSKTGVLNSNLYGLNFKSLNLDLPHYNKEHYIVSENSYTPKLVVSLSSWNKRIKNVYTVINDILHNSFVPDKIVLNLAKTNFIDVVGDLTEYELDLKTLVFKDKFPEDLYKLITDNKDIIEVHWYNDASLKSWKKYVYVTQQYRDDIIVIIDDDVRYSPLFLETMLKSYHYYGSKYPISIFPNFCQGGFGLSGQAFLYTPKMLDYFNPKYFTDEILHNFPEDNHLLNVVNYFEYPIMPVIGYDYLFMGVQDLDESNSNFGNYNFDEKWYESYGKLINISNKILYDNKKDHMRIYGYSPECYNYTIYNLYEFLKQDRNSLPKYTQDVYDAIEIYLNDSPGTKFSSELYKKINNVFL